MALQAQHRQLISAYNSALTACSLAGKTAPSVDILGRHEVQEALRRPGVAPEYR